MRRPWHPGAVALVTALCAVTLIFGWWTKARCLDGGWQDGEQYTRWCYTDVYPLYFSQQLDEGAMPYLDHPVEYPVLTGAQMWAAAQVVRALPPDRRPAAFFHLTALAGAALLAAVVWLLARDGVAPLRLVWLAATPTLAVYAFMNWDPLPVLALTAGVWLHRRERDAAAGVAAGLGAAAKVYPGLLVPLVVATRLAQRRPRDAAVHAAAAAGAWGAVNLPVALAAPEGWRRFFELNRSRQADWDSLWYLAEQVRNVSFEVATVNRWSAVVFLAGAAVIAAVGVRGRPSQRWWELALPLLCWFLLTNKVYSPQFSLWLLPLLAVALPHGAPLAAFALADLAVFLTRFRYLGGLVGAEPALGYLPFGAAVGARAVVLVWIIVAASSATFFTRSKTVSLPG